MSHGKLICKECKTVLVQCRCPDHGNNITESSGPCDNCVIAKAKPFVYTPCKIFSDNDIGEIYETVHSVKLENCLNEFFDYVYALKRCLKDFENDDGHIPKTIWDERNRLLGLPEGV